MCGNVDCTWLISSSQCSMPQYKMSQNRRVPSASLCVCDAQDFSINVQTARFNSYVLLFDGRIVCSGVLEPHHVCGRGHKTFQSRLKTVRFKNQSPKITEPYV